MAPLCCQPGRCCVVPFANVDLDVAFDEESCNFEVSVLGGLVDRTAVPFVVRCVDVRPLLNQQLGDAKVPILTC